ncbi:hypothetical protein LEH94_19105 [Salmonella enterica]|nr:MULTISPECIES: hypothetical protein [Salmonella]MDR5455370.1 hypothetical protein [Salmonella enterica subsp. enterica serovar Apeyeme]MCW6814440.1 hypothetical protein [Salmonella enterica]MCW6821974.1 hypothetical protein [Salmonella enterica]MCW6833293.1 hypothetical protein [Salmonella enterica subsp. arizonae]MDJ3552021.1 hypothetical protein [Salmonella enterica]
MPPVEQHSPPMDISLISLVEVHFAYGKPLRLNMSDVSSGSNFFPLNVMTRTDAPEGPINRIYRNGNYVTQMDAVGPDVFKLTILNAKTTAEHVVGEETVET